MIVYDARIEGTKVAELQLKELTDSYSQIYFGSNYLGKLRLHPNNGVVIQPAYVGGEYTYNSVEAALSAITNTEGVEFVEQIYDVGF